MPQATSILVPVSPGELIDKITILEIKSERITDADKLHNVRAELDLLLQARNAAVPPSDELAHLTAELKHINQTLWQVEDVLRDCERRRDFGPTFIQLARSVYRHNDHRATLKRRINQRLGCSLLEEKSYAPY